MKLYQMSEWQGATGYWYCNNVDNLGAGSGVWYLPARMMGLTPANYLKWIINEFHPDKVYASEDGGFVGFCWASQSNMRAFKNKINQIARQTRFMI